MLTSHTYLNTRCWLSDWLPDEYIWNLVSKLYQRCKHWRDGGLLSSGTSGRWSCSRLRHLQSLHAVAGGRRRRNVPGTSGSPSGYLICVYECSEDRITPVRSARLNKVSTYPGIVRHTLTRSLLAIAVELVSVVVDSPDDAHPFLATRIVAIPWKEHLTARVNSKLLMLVHTFSNQKSTSGWALLNISVSLSLYG